MAQSGQPYGVERPKSTAQSSSYRETDEIADPKPACRELARDGCDWRTPPYSDNLAGIHPLCERCFSGDDAPATGEPVVMSRTDPTVLHRLCDEQNLPEPGENLPTYRYCDAIHKADGLVDSLAAFRAGDGVVWRTPQIPLEVVSITVSEVQLRGPGGGTYVLEENDDNYSIYPGYGRIFGLSRVEFANDRWRKG